MNNKGQTTVLFSLMISILFLFTLTTLEVGRIYMSKVKIIPCVHSMRSSIMADYNEELFERYHLLFMDPTYGTGSEAVAEEKIIDYLEISLNGENEKDNAIYEFSIEEATVVDTKNILDEDMELLKKQILEYEKSAGIAEVIEGLLEKKKQNPEDLQKASKETEMNATELNIPNSASEDTFEETEEVEDPRKTLQEALKSGILEFLLPGNDFSKTPIDFKDSPSGQYREQREQEKNNSFQDINWLKGFLKEKESGGNNGKLQRNAAFAHYVSEHFSNGVNGLEESQIQCEVEYILKGKNSDYDNLEAVVNEIVWSRMPLNYAYLLTDTEKKSQALTVAATICTMTGTEALTEIVKYLLLGCWSYGESLYEVKVLLSGQKISIMKNNACWYTDLNNLLSGKTYSTVEGGIGYQEYLLLLLADEGGKDICYARMLDIIEKNIQKDNPRFFIRNCVGELEIQGKISIDERFIKQDRDLYTYYFNEIIAYE